MKRLDFIIVGAQKCATTTIHKYLQEHPGIDLPVDKEAPFFNSQNFNAKHYKAFLRENYLDCGAKEGNLWGKASPQYMSSPLIPARLKSENPDAKVIAILKDPVKRAFSHYQMAVRRGTETRSFEEAIAHNLEYQIMARGRSQLAPQHAQGYQSESDFYLAWGEYGRILQNYRNEFGEKNLLVIFTDDLQANPGDTLDKLLDFIGLETGWRPEALGKHFHKGGGKPVIHPGVFRQLANLPVVRQVYARVPENRKRKLRYWVDQINVKKTTISQDLPPHLLRKLYGIYRADAARLIALGLQPPWLKHDF